MCLSIRDGDWHKASRPGRVLVGQTWCWIKSSVANKLLYVLPALSTLPCWRFSSCSQRACARATKLLYVLFTSLQPPPLNTHTRLQQAGPQSAQSCNQPQKQLRHFPPNSFPPAAALMVRPRQGWLKGRRGRLLRRGRHGSGGEEGKGPHAVLIASLRINFTLPCKDLHGFSKAGPYTEVCTSKATEAVE